MSSTGALRVPGRTGVDGARLDTAWREINRRVGARWSGWSARGRNRKAQETIEKVRRELTDLNATTEDAFLAVGSQLQDLQSGAQAVARAATSIARILSNDVGAHTLISLDEVLEYGRARSDAGARADEIQKFTSSAKAIQASVAHFEHVVKSFDVLSIMTRIESSRFGSSTANFDALADDVSNLSRRIREQMNTTAGLAEALAENASAAALQIRNVALDQQQNLKPLSERVRAGLVRIQDHCGRSADTAERLAMRFEEVSRKMGDVVSALQFQDIIRQQIEHVLEALNPASYEPGLQGRNTQPNIRLQAAQLDNARETFLSSVESVRNALMGIDRNVAEMFAESSQLLGSSATGTRSFFVSVEEDFDAIAAILDRNTSGDRRLAGIDSAVRAMLAEMTASVADVQAIGIQMLRVSLNAMVQGIRLGSQGSTLHTIAQAIQSLARGLDETCGQIQRQFETIHGIADALTISAEGPSGANPECANLHQSITDLRAIHERTEESYKQTAPLVDHFAKQIQETIQMFGTQEEVADVLAHATKALQEVAPAADSAPVGLDPLSTAYTMHAERSVHTAVLLGDPAGLAKDGANEAAENVEFF